MDEQQNKLHSEVVQFVKDHPELFEEVGRWLDEHNIDNLNYAWELASTSGDWDKVLYVAGQCDNEEKIFNVLYANVRYSTSKHPSELLIRNAFDKGKRAVKQDQNEGRLKAAGTGEGNNEHNADDKERSRPLFSKDWAYIFGLSRNKMREIREENEVYHFRQVSPRKWTLPRRELPAEYLEKYRNVTTNKSPQ